MTVMEVLTLKLGAAIVKLIAKGWIGEEAKEIAGSLTDTLEKSITDFSTRRASLKLFENLQDSVANELSELIDHLFPQLPDNEREAATLAVADVLEKLSPSTAIFTADLDATRLEAAAKELTALPFRDLSAAGEQLALLLLRESCNYIVVLCGKMPNFHVAATKRILQAHRELATDLEQVLKNLSDMRKDLPGSSQDAKSFELQYRRALIQKLDRLELFGLRLAGAGAREYPLTIAYVTLTVTSSSDREPYPVDAALAGKTQVLIRGEAGSGKSTLLQWLAVRASKRDFAEPIASWNKQIPIYIRLRDYAVKELPAPERMIEGMAKNLIALMPDRWAHTELINALLLIDGLDELPANRRRKFVEWLRDLRVIFPQSIMVVSSRPAALESREPIHLDHIFAEAGFVSLTLEPMTPSDSEALIAQWHSAVAEDRPNDRPLLDAYEKGLRQTIRDRPPIRNLASNPLLCAMICALNWDRRQRLPDARMQLYQEALQMLLIRRDEERDVRAAFVSDLSDSEKIALLEGIAYWMLRNGYSEAEEFRVREQIESLKSRLPKLTATPEIILQELLERSGVLRRPQYEKVDFIHRTFLEFLAANAAISDNDLGLLAENAEDESWRETIVFAAGHAKGKARDNLIRELLQRRWFRSKPIQARVTAACCLETVGDNLDPPLFSSLRDLAKSLFPPDTPEMARILAPAAAMEPSLLRGHSSSGPQTVAACIRAAAIVGGEKMLGIIADYASVTGRAVDLALIHAWPSFDTDEFSRMVIQRRESLMDISTSELSTDDILCLGLLVEYGGGSPVELKSRLEAFRKDGTLRLTKADPEGTQDKSADTSDLLGQALYKKPESVQQRNTGAALRYSDARKLACLKALRLLALEKVDQEILNVMSDLPNLRHLLLSQCSDEIDLSPLGRAKELESLQFDRSNVREFRPLISCTKLQSIHLLSGSHAVRSLDGIARRLKSLKLQYVKDGRIEDMEKMPSLEDIKIAGASLASMDWMNDLAQLKILQFAYVESTLSIPFSRIPALRRFWGQSIPVNMLDHLDETVSIDDCILIDIRTKSDFKLRSNQFIKYLYLSGITANVTDTMLSGLETLYIGGDVKISGIEVILTWPKITYLTVPAGFLPIEVERELLSRNIAISVSGK